MNLPTGLPHRFLVICLIGCSLAFAQQDDGVRGTQGTVRNGRIVSGNIMVAGPGMLEEIGGELVTGQPFSGEQVLEHRQTLANGTHIDQKREAQLMYRDSEGRRRTERVMFSGMGSQTASKQPGFRLIHIYDPVAGYSYTLDTEKHIAHRFAVPPASEHRPPIRTAGVVAPLPLQGSAPRLRPPALQNREMKRELLGSSVIEGVTVEGSRVTITTPTGVVGNDRPMARICEHWRSEELRLTMLSKCSDPRTGNSVIRVKNLERAEPDPLLFEVPPDYTVVDEEGPFIMGYRSSALNEH
jgi:hypothetical protein